MGFTRKSNAAYSQLAACAQPEFVRHRRGFQLTVKSRQHFPINIQCFLFQVRAQETETAQHLQNRTLLLPTPLRKPEGKPVFSVLLCMPRMQFQAMGCCHHSVGDLLNARSQNGQLRQTYNSVT